MLVRSGVQRERVAATLRKQWKLGAHAYLILAIGRLSREKGHRDLVEAVKILREHQMPLRLLVVGIASCCLDTNGIPSLTTNWPMFSSPLPTPKDRRMFCSRQCLPERRL